MAEKKDKLIIILGPTASGKTDLSLDIAQALDGEIISGDSMQVYRGMDIGTAKLPLDQRRGIPHHLIDIIDPDQPYSVADFQTMTQTLVREIHARGRMPIVAGGTGLYIWSLIHPYLFGPQEGAQDAFRAQKRAELAQKGSQELYQELQTLDPAAAAKIHPNDSHRLVRALEVYHSYGKRISDIQAESQRLEPPPYDLLLIGLHMERQCLYQRINQRAEQMVQAGLVEEVRGLLENGYSRALPSMQGLGYRQMAAYLAGEWTLPQALERLQTDTRRFAKRQITWFKREPRIQWFLKEDYPGQGALTSAVLSRVEQAFGKGQIRS